MQLEIQNSKELPINCLRNRLWIVLRVHGMQRLFEAWRNDAAWTRRSGRNHMGFTSGYKKGQQEVTNKFGNGYFHCEKNVLEQSSLASTPANLLFQIQFGSFSAQLIKGSLNNWLVVLSNSEFLVAFQVRCFTLIDCTDWFHWFKSHCN